MASVKCTSDSDGNVLSLVIPLHAGKIRDPDAFAEAYRLLVEHTDVKVVSLGEIEEMTTLELYERYQAQAQK